MPEIKYLFNPEALGTLPIQHKNKRFRQPCGCCGTSIVFEKGDKLILHTNKENSVDALLCIDCAPKFKK